MHHRQDRQMIIQTVEWRAGSAWAIGQSFCNQTVVANSPVRTTSVFRLETHWFAAKAPLATGGENASAKISSASSNTSE